MTSVKVCSHVAERAAGSPRKGKQSMLRWCVKRLRQGLHPLIESLNEHYKQWTRPDTGSLVTGTLIDVTRSKRDLIAENAFLRQQESYSNVKRPTRR
jgi:hypothetical protein